MLRSTAKNHAFTCIVTSPDQYSQIQEEIAAKGGMSVRVKFGNGLIMA